MEIIPINLMGETLKSEEINQLILENSICNEILSDVLESLDEIKDGK